MTSIAARALAAKKAAAAEAAAAEAKKGKGSARAPIARPNHPDQPVPTPRTAPSRVSPASQRKAFLIASTAGGILAAKGVVLDVDAGNDNREVEVEAARILTQLAEDVRTLKSIKSIEKKIERKRDLLPAYQSWCAGVLMAGKSNPSPLDEIFTQVMAWTVDVGDFIAAMPMIEHATRYEMEMPDRFDRDVLSFAVEQISEAATAAYDAGGDAAATFPAAVLTQLEDLIEELDADLHDEITAKLYRALGEAVLAGAKPDDDQDLAERRAHTLRSFERAYALDNSVGVKTQITKLKKQLGVTEVAPAADAGAAAADAAAPAADNPGAAETPPPAPDAPASSEEG